MTVTEFLPSGSDPRVLPDLLRNAYRVFADRTAIIDEQRSYTFRETAEVVDCLVSGLIDAGLGPGDCVAIISGNRSECLLWDQACYLGGFVRLSLNKRLHPREAAGILRTADAQALIVDKDWRNAISPELTNIPSLRLLVDLDNAADEAGESALDAMPHVAMSDLLERGAAHPSIPEPTAADAMAQLAFTSGTTGQPKGVIHTQPAIAAGVRNTIIETDASASDVVYTPMPLSHVGGTFALAYFIRGATQIVAATFDPEDAVTALEKRGVTVLVLVPSMVTAINKLIVGRSAPALRRIIYGSSPMPVNDIVRTLELFGPVLVQLYGQTEAGFISALAPPDHEWTLSAEPPARLASVGRPTNYAAVRCVDENGDEVSEGEVGEVEVRSDAAMSGYLNDDTASAAVMEGGWIRTGDLGRWSDGFLTLVGRSREVIISGGFNVYPVEVENELKALDGVGEVAVLGIPDEKWGETVCAVVVPNGEFDKDLATAHVRSRLAGFKIPRRFSTVPELPRNSVGKIMKDELRRKIIAERSHE